MKPAACSWRVITSSIADVRSDSTTSRFSSPGMPKMRSTPSFSSAATRRSEPLVMEGYQCWLAGRLFEVSECERCRLEYRLLPELIHHFSIEEKSALSLHIPS